MRQRRAKRTWPLTEVAVEKTRVELASSARKAVVLPLYDFPEVPRAGVEPACHVGGEV